MPSIKSPFPAYCNAIAALLIVLICCDVAAVLPASAQPTPTAFRRVGSQDESRQDFFPGEIRARPVLGNYTQGQYMGLFCGGQDLAGPQQDFYADPRWGDQGDGTFANPVLNADFSDPDVIRVGSKYYMTCSEFHFMGMPILESDDMVNWQVVAQIYSSIDLPGYSSMSKYGGGTWAPALREHDGRFYMYVCTPDEGLFMSTADDIRGPWAPLHQVRAVSGWEDPCPFWDEDGQAYLGRSQLGGGPIIIHRMSADGRTLLDDGTEVYRGDTSEGTKLFKRDGWYYLSIPEGGVGTGWQQVLRSRSIYGPYEGRTVLERGVTNVNGPHQGALVDTPEGEWWFFHFQSHDPQGRVVHLQPVVWGDDGFPAIGTDYDGNGIGEPMKICRKPATGVASAVHYPQGSDDFSSASLHPMWQWNHNPDSSRFSLSERPGWLTIHPRNATTLRQARNQLTQKLMGYSGQATVLLDFAELNDSSRSGLECIGSNFVGAGIRKGGGKTYLYWEREGKETIVSALSSVATTIHLRLTFDAIKNEFQFSYSLDGSTFTDLGDTFNESSRDWKGARIGLYSFTAGNHGGRAHFDNFTYEFQ